MRRVAIIAGALWILAAAYEARQDARRLRDAARRDVYEREVERVIAEAIAISRAAAGNP